MINLYKLRKEKGLTQTQISLKLGVVKNTVSQWETGTREPSIEKLKELAKILDTNLDNLLNFNQVAKKETKEEIKLNEEQKALIDQFSNFTEEQKSLFNKLKTLDDFQCKRVALYIERMIEDDRKEEETVKMLYNQYHNKNKFIEDK